MRSRSSSSTRRHHSTLVRGLLHVFHVSLEQGIVGIESRQEMDAALGLPMIIEEHAPTARKDHVSVGRLQVLGVIEIDPSAIGAQQNDMGMGFQEFLELMQERRVQFGVGTNDPQKLLRGLGQHAGQRKGLKQVETGLSEVQQVGLQLLKSRFHDVHHIVLVLPLHVGQIVLRNRPWLATLVVVVVVVVVDLIGLKRCHRFTIHHHGLKQGLFLVLVVVVAQCGGRRLLFLSFRLTLRLHEHHTIRRTTTMNGTLRKPLIIAILGQDHHHAQGQATCEGPIISVGTSSFGIMPRRGTRRNTTATSHGGKGSSVHGYRVMMVKK
mmetsp:Transcript_22561/g.53207  ORF Transcript_22561/g.53207 Transcript_22561/m.53207 type:complete len:323 (+) Transcript_22561:767-1735(+)